MVLIVCVDDHNGMMFNHRRQSQDRILRADILELTDGKKLWMNAYSKKQFAESDTARIRVNETFLDAAGTGILLCGKCGCLRLCGADRGDLSLPLEQGLSADVYFPVDLSVWKCVETKEFAGSSHEKITRERYTR